MYCIIREFLGNFVQNGCSSDNIADCPKFDNKDNSPGLHVFRAIWAVETEFFVRYTGQITPEFKTICFYVFVRFGHKMRFGSVNLNLIYYFTQFIKNNSEI
ncbi:MAG: hypothetical protein AMXMBFR48_11880 [Ignavibacteriales bacterium]